MKQIKQVYNINREDVEAFELATEKTREEFELTVELLETRTAYKSYQIEAEGSGSMFYLGMYFGEFKAATKDE